MVSTWKRIGVNVTDETRVMSQEDNERSLDNNLMCDMVNDVFGYLIGLYCTIMSIKKRKPQNHIEYEWIPISNTLHYRRPQTSRAASSS